jgi:YD repeat-containing protein
VNEAEVRNLLTDAKMSMNIGDINGDSHIDQTAGNIVKIIYPTVRLPTESNTAKLYSDTKQHIEETFAYNQFGQITAKRDAERNTTQYE